MASKPWSADEEKVLERHAHRRDWFGAVASEIRDRSPTALHSRMQLVRADLGLTQKRGPYRPQVDEDSDHNWMTLASDASRQLLEATLRVGTWS
jgi:hypothetical protein